MRTENYFMKAASHRGESLFIFPWEPLVRELRRKLHIPNINGSVTIPALFAFTFFPEKKRRNKWAEKEGKRETLKKKGRKKEEEGGWAGKAEEEEDNRTTRRRSIPIVSMLHTVAVASWVQSERKGTH